MDLQKQNESSSPPEQQTFVPSFTACENQVLNNLSSSSLSDFISFFFLNSRFSFSLTILCCCEKNENDQHSQFESFLGENMLALLKEQRTEIQNASCKDFFSLTIYPRCTFLSIRLGFIDASMSFSELLASLFVFLVCCFCTKPLAPKGH